MIRHTALSADSIGECHGCRGVLALQPVGVRTGVCVQGVAVPHMWLRTKPCSRPASPIRGAVVLACASLWAVAVAVVLRPPLLLPLLMLSLWTLSLSAAVVCV